jgi:hypothetical protein
MSPEHCYTFTTWRYSLANDNFLVKLFVKAAIYIP